MSRESLRREQSYVAWKHAADDYSYINLRKRKAWPAHGSSLIQHQSLPDESGVGHYSGLRKHWDLQEDVREMLYAPIC